MNKLIILLIISIVVTGCMSTATQTSDHSYLIETIEFPHSSKSDGFYYAKLEWLKHANKLCRGKKIIGEPKYRNVNTGLTVLPSATSTEEEWIIAFGEVACT